MCGRPAKRARKNNPNIQEQQEACSASYKNLPFKKRPYPKEKELPVPIKNKIVQEMGGSCLLFVVEKELKKIDVRQKNSSFRIYKTQIANKFVNREEKAKLEKGIDVKMLICGHDYQPGREDEVQVKGLTLKKWAIKNSYMYAFIKDWDPIVQEHDLVEGMLVQLWAFRVQNQLHFALVKL